MLGPALFDAGFLERFALAALGKSSAFRTAATFDTGFPTHNFVAVAGVASGLAGALRKTLIAPRTAKPAAIIFSPCSGVVMTPSAVARDTRPRHVEFS